jgi:hypothetical protein
VCLRQLGGNRAGEVKLGRWLANEKVTKEELTDHVVDKTRQAVRDRHVLAIQDTTEVNYQAHAERVSGLGVVAKGKGVGFLLHPMLVVDAEEEVCLGLSSIKSWIREERSSKDRKRLIEAKESYCWLETVEASREVLSEARLITVIADREGDIYEAWIRIPDARTYFLTRACQDRRLEGGGLLFSYVKKLPVSGTYELEVKKVVGKRSAHCAKLEIRFGEAVIRKPYDCTDKGAPQQVKLSVVDVKELPETVVGREAPIHWCLLTTHEVKTRKEALRIVSWYTQRWYVEQLFRTLKKQGLNIESSQVETGKGLMKLVVLALYGALQVMQLTLSRTGKDQAISVLFGVEEYEAMSKLQSKLEGKTKKQKNPHPPDQLSWASWIIARLGGWKGYASESPAGPITMLRGLKRFESFYDGYLFGKMCA